MLCFCLLLAAQAAMAGRSQVPAGMELVFREEDDKPIYLSYSASSNSPAHRELDILEAKLYVDEAKNNAYGCKRYKPIRDNAAVVAVTKRGGGCTFSEKLAHAQNAGAAALIVVNAAESLYNQTTGQIMDACALNCDLFSSPDLSTCNTKCTCAKAANDKYCCVDPGVVSMYIDSVYKIPAYSASIEDSKSLLLAAAKQKRVEIRFRAYSEWDPSLFCIYFFSCAVLIVCSYFAALEASKSNGMTVLPSSSPKQEDEDEVMLTTKSSLVFLLGSTLSLLVLFLLIQYFPAATVFCIQVLFAFAASNSLNQILARHVGPATGAKVNQRFLFVLCMCVGLFSVLTRHFAFAWITNNLLAVCVCFTFLLHVRVPNLRVAAVLLATFFCYDVFMVFLTPLLFGGKSVMVEVATAGRANEYIDSNGQCVRQVEEKLPMLFAWPRSDFMGGFAMLGLGDVVLPGLLVALALRVDIAKQSSSPSGILSGYWFPVCLSYCVGLALALVANAMHWTFNGVAGQPALMYLVPCTLFCFFGLVLLRQDWNLVSQDV